MITTTKKTKAPFFAEVTESSLYGWKAQSWEWSFSPSFGSLVTLQTNNRIWFGIVYQSATVSNYPSRQPYAYQKTDTELMAEQPQIFNFLPTLFRQPFGKLKTGNSTSVPHIRSDRCRLNSSTSMASSAS